MKPTILSRRLDKLAKQMQAVAAELDYYGGFAPHASDRSRELSDAANVVRGWSVEMLAADEARSDSSAAKA